MRRFGKRLKWFGILAGSVLLIGLGVNWYTVRSSGAQIERRIKALRDAGEPLELRDLARKTPLPPDRNGAVDLRRAAADLKAIHGTLQGWYPETVYPTDAMSQADQERLEALFAQYPEVMPLLENAAGCADYDPELNAALTPPLLLDRCMQMVTEHRLLIRVLRARTALLLAQGKRDDALRVQILSLQFTRQWRRDPLLIGCLVVVACECAAMDGANDVLQSGPVSSSARHALETELALHDTLDGFRRAVQTERVYSLSSVQGMLPLSGGWLTRTFENRLYLRLLSFYDRESAAASRPYFERNRESRPSKTPPPRSIRWLDPYGVIVDQLAPAWDSARGAVERSRAVARSLRVLNALQALEPARSGIDLEPGSMSRELGLPAEATVDPFNGQPLRVEKRPEGWLVYSVGQNLEDDGGVLEKGVDAGVGPKIAEPQEEEAEEDDVSSAPSSSRNSSPGEPE